MATIVTNRTNDICEITSKLSGHIDIRSISTDQVLGCEKGESVNGLMYIGTKFGLWFYTSRNAIDNLCYLKNEKLPTYVVCAGSASVYEIK
jgi:hypothetical protein